MHLGAIRDEAEDDPLRFGGVCGPEHADSVRLEGDRCSSDASLIRQRREPTADWRIEVG